MLMLTLPQSELAGTCRINGQLAEYRVLQDHLEFRYAGQEAWDRRRILDAFRDGDLICYWCDDGQATDGPYCVIRPDEAPSSDEFYWLAVNGASVAASGLPMPVTVRVRPTPEQLIGFRTREAHLATQKFMLTAPTREIDKFMKNVMPGKIKSGEVVYMRPDNPEPPTQGPTMWECGPVTAEGERP